MNENLRSLDLPSLHARCKDCTDRWIMLGMHPICKGCDVFKVLQEREDLLGETDEDS